MKRTIFLFATLFCCIAHATETTNWYIEGSVYATTTCESGDDVTMPATLPEKFGYTFQGWMPAIYDMSTLNANINASTYTSNATTKRWTSIFSYGTIYGNSLCSTVDISALRHPDEDISTYDAGQYCWCIITGFVPTGSDILYEPLRPRWSHAHGYNTISECNKGCYNICGLETTRTANYRRVLLAQQ